MLPLAPRFPSRAPTPSQTYRDYQQSVLITPLPYKLHSLTCPFQSASAHQTPAKLPKGFHVVNHDKQTLSSPYSPSQGASSILDHFFLLATFSSLTPSPACSWGSSCLLFISLLLPPASTWQSACLKVNTWALCLLYTILNYLIHSRV